MLLPERVAATPSNRRLGASLHEDNSLETLTLPAPGDLHDWLATNCAPPCESTEPSAISCEHSRVTETAARVFPSRRHSIADHFR